MSGLRRLVAGCAVALLATGLVVAPLLTPPASAAELIQDGGFESSTGSPPNSPAWTEFDSLQGTPLCPSSNCSSRCWQSPVTACTLGNRTLIARLMFSRSSSVW